MQKLETKKFNVFEVRQISPETFLSEIAGVDYVEIAPMTRSEVHKHNKSDSILYVVSGSATVKVGNDEHNVFPGIRLIVPKGVSHGFRTSKSRLKFISIQIPPILDPKKGVFDREIVSE